MKAMANYVMRGRLQATMMASIFAVLSLILPPLSYISGGVLALVTLRKGPIDGLVVAGAATALLAVLSYLSTQTMVIALVFVLVLWLPVWLLAIILRNTISLGLTLVAAALFCIVAVVGFHISVGDAVNWWNDIMQQMFQEAAQQPGMDMMQGMEMMQRNVAQMMTAIMAVAFFASMVLSLLLGRWWQALLYNPGGFQQEFHQFRIDRIFAAIGAVILVWAAVSGSMGSLPVDVAIVICAYASVAGLALVHDWVNVRQANKAWLIVLYLLLAFVAPQILALLAVVGFADAWLDIRKFYRNKAV